jgi:pantothenate kinase
VGTFGGAIFVYGDGFQLVRPWLNDNPIEVAFMVAVYPNKLFVTFSDNSAQLLELPSLTLLALLGSNWITNRNENITTVYVDEAGQLPFAFVGTSEGVVSVLDLSGPSSIRVCDYVISWKAIGLKSAYQVTDIQIYPKDEKYLAISYDSITSSAGHVVIFDLTKQKPYRSYDTTNAIVSLAWQHQGDMLFAGELFGRDSSMSAASFSATADE